MKNKFKTVKLFSGVAVMATLCFMASGVGATRAPEGNNIHDVAHYKRLLEEAGAARDRMKNACEADVNAARGRKIEASRAEMTAEVMAINKRWREAHNAYMLAAKEKWFEAHGAELEDILRQCDESYRAMIDAKQ